MSFAYFTADTPSRSTGGGVVTLNEILALSEMGHCHVQTGELLPDDLSPFEQDEFFASIVRGWDEQKIAPELAHCYSGCLSKTVEELKKRGVKVCYTVAAHSIAVSREEHEKLGIPYDYPHLTDPELWARYSAGYRGADLRVVPSRHSDSVMQEYGLGQCVVVPHGVDLPDRPPVSLPATFTVGYLGAIGPDKGLRYLLEAWKILNYRDAVLKIAGRQSTAQLVKNLVRIFGGGRIELCGWVDSVSDFYDSLSLYVQPSATEGFGIEVLEAMAHGRPVVCSESAGASDVLTDEHMVCPARDPHSLAESVRSMRDFRLDEIGRSCRAEAEKYTWDTVRTKYQEIWKGMLS